jgi:hypothetical protein
LFALPDDEHLPTLTGVVDWDSAHTGPLHYLFDYPKFIQDVDWHKSLYAENKVLRQEFARALQEYYRDDPVMREQAYRCLQEKTHVLNRFRGLFVLQERSEDD